ncbi:MAG TPA: tRNA (adenosine(37)-N6)-threonylcarbamoyltransferase complex ATPase subunit type 1 TsaE [Bacillota bacterium]|jgi:tRNA threonylcarbamoyladenosine biosynthesis protein TsaE|nr:tRNA (adenosine(37)-N6)-threonylcarbamoyltransferase complex ATPase subunit type 1 TsaE [Bacillota bacterium]HOL08893.1 tRNA (adenosine(37)-N6)-threonylcarbamoyltransferase complex ATPase subunit type 1 TsaE [Bacillota bacterium]HPO96586.1 tRNA (adenosine(37)-N6)-threonylcarbamoyltransferase complex ATPase subunit type 1 TsaE [Bacillota bacterium]
MKTIIVDSETAMIDLGKKLGANLLPGDLLFLFGDLGAGKTTLTKGIAQGLGIDEVVTSPTFQLKKTYIGEYTLNHLDLYRLRSLFELDIIEPDELIEEGITIVEWGKMLLDKLQTDYLEVKIELLESGSRQVILIPRGARYQKLVAEIAI